MSFLPIFSDCLMGADHMRFAVRIDNLDLDLDLDLLQFVRFFVPDQDQDKEVRSSSPHHLTGPA